MKIFLLIAALLTLGFGFSQKDNLTATYHIDSLDTIRSGDIAFVYSGKVLLERLHYIEDVIDVTVLYIYKDGQLVRREWWKKGKKFSETWE